MKRWIVIATVLGAMAVPAMVSGKKQRCCFNYSGKTSQFRTKPYSTFHLTLSLVGRKGSTYDMTARWTDHYTPLPACGGFFSPGSKVTKKVKLHNRSFSIHRLTALPGSNVHTVSNFKAKFAHGGVTGSFTDDYRLGKTHCTTGHVTFSAKQ